MVRPLAEARDIRVRVHVNGPAPLRTDPDKLREILTNLLHNAIQYNRPQGTIDVAVERHNGTVDVEVQDSGIGIAPDVKEQIFERFYRADPSRHADGMHTGLGLAIVKGLHRSDGRHHRRGQRRRRGQHLPGPATGRA